MGCYLQNQSALTFLQVLGHRKLTASVDQQAGVPTAYLCATDQDQALNGVGFTCKALVQGLPTYSKKTANLSLLRKAKFIRESNQEKSTATRSS